MNRFFKKTKLIFFLNLVSIGFVTFFASLLPVLTGNLIDNILTLNSSKILIYIILYITIVVLLLIFEYFNKLFNSKYKKKVMILLKGELFSKILSFSYNNYKKNDTDYYINLFLDDSNMLFTDYYDTILDFSKSLVQAIIYSFVMFFMNWILAGVILVLSLLSLIIPEITGRELSKKKEIMSKNNQKYISVLKDILSGVDVVSTTTKSELKFLYDKTDKEKEESSYKFSKYSSFVQIFTGISLYLVNIGVFIVGIFLITSKMILVGEFVALLSFTELMSIPFRDILYQIIGIKSSKNIRQKFNQVLFYENEIKTTIPSINHTIELKDINYEIDEFKLKNVNIEFEVGGKYAIIGNSGSGKTTILKILMGFIDDYSGNVIIDGVISKELDLSKAISYIDQNQFIFNASAMDNITLFSNNKNENLLKNITRLNADYLLGKDLGELGSKISGGEKNKISLLRALNSGSKIIVCDEMLSNLDKQNSSDILDFLLGSDLTIIMVTHDVFLKNLERFDKIIKIDNGSVV